MVLVRNLCWMVCIVSCFTLGVWQSPAMARSASAVMVDATPGQPVQVEVNRMVKLRAPVSVSRAMVINEKIAEIYISDTQSPNWVFVAGKSVGTTQLTLWGSGNRMIGSFEITVRPDVSGLKRHIHELFPQEKIQVSDAGGSITLSGLVSGATKLDKLLAVTEAYAPGKVINLVQVGGIQQVMLEVRVAEISKRVGQKLGVNFSILGSEAFGISLLDGLTAIPSEGWPGNPLLVSPAVNAIFGFIDGNETYTAAIDALQEDGLLKILAKPTLIAQSGRSASFLAGGEFPFPVSQGDDQVTIEWKPFGVGLNFTPTVLGDDKISLLVSPEVSELDFTKTISYGGFVVPSIDTRRMSTVVELGDNQSFAIAGLMKNYVRESISKFPLLGDIPILGALFRSTRYQNDETELLVIVTPRLVKPVDGDQLALPTDSFVPPNAFELLLLGRLEGTRKTTATAGPSPGRQGARPASLEGDFGHIIPD
jgi:pilus assembly protein CpaC